jgi:hypothetical protein
VPLRRSLPIEQPGEPLHGYKLAYPVVASDGRRAGFSGLTIGAHRVYGVTADATCPWNRRHAPPKRACTCGFYCVHKLEAARELVCDSDHRGAVILEVVASGRFIRYESGLRFARQRVMAVHVGRCKCGRPGAALTDSGAGMVGWRRLEPSCGSCRPWSVITLVDFAALLGGAVAVVADDDWPERPSPNEDLSLAVVAGEIALLQARIDELQAQVVRLSGPQS